ncbi:MAG: exonuclease subunit SbcD [SAR202 cluster bacterium]|nr:exonuclease subunit SbcD [SAR202 cluster bacterium]
MRIVHFSDVHIGVENYSRIDPKTGFSTRLLDFLNSFDQVIDYSINTNVDLVVFCGDAYKNRDPSQTHQREFAKRIALLSNKGIPTVLIVGNHDVPLVANKASALDIYSTLDIPNIYIGNTLKTHLITTPAGPIQILALPWIRRSNYLAKNDKAPLTPEEINFAIQESLTRAIQNEVKLLDQSIPTILAGHITIGEAKTSSEISMMLGSDYLLLKSQIALPDFDYVALGHIHRHQILEESPPVVYSGSLERIDFGEENDKKGFCLVTIDPSQKQGKRIKSLEFKNVNARKFLTIPITISETSSNPIEDILSNVLNFTTEDSIVRIKIKAPQKFSGLLTENLIRKSITNIYYLAQISIEYTHEKLIHKETNETSSNDPIGLLKVFLKNQDTDPQKTQTLIDRANQIFDEINPNEI